MRKYYAIPMFLALFAVVSCGSPAVKPEEPKKLQITEDMIPTPILEANVFPLFSDTYRGGLRIDSDSKLYIWNGCRIQTVSTADDYYEPTDYWKIIVNPGVDWFGWGLHHHPSGYRDMKGFQAGYLAFAFKASAKSGPVKIGIKSGYVNESWIPLTNGVYGARYDNEWHLVKIPFKDFFPRIQFGTVNAFFMFTQQVAPAVIGSIYYIDALLWVKDTNFQAQNVLDIITARLADTNS